jgi:predicted Zn-dependent protease
MIRMGSKLVLGCALIALSYARGSTQDERRLQEQVRLHPEDFTANRALGEFYIQENKLTAAIPFLEHAREIDPTNYDNAYDLALAYLQTGAFEKSRRIIDDLIKDGDKAELHNLLGDVGEREGHVDEAARQYELAARMNPSEKNLFDLGSDLLSHRGFEPALKVFEYACQRYPGSAKLRVGLAVADYSLGRYDEAVDALCQSVDLDPADPRALEFLGNMHDVSPERSDEVTKRLAHFVELYPQNAAANYFYAVSLRKRNLTGGHTTSDMEAEKRLRTAIALRPRWAQPHYELGLLYEDQNRDAEAIREYKHATSLSADLTKAHYRLGRLYQRNGQTVLAQQEFQLVEALKTKQQKDERP